MILPFYSLGVSNVDSGNTIADNDCDDSRVGNNDDGMIDRLETRCSAAGGSMDRSLCSFFVLQNRLPLYSQSLRLRQLVLVRAPPMIGWKHVVQQLAMRFHGQFFVQFLSVTEPTSAVQPIAVQTSENCSINLRWYGRRL